MLTFQDFDGRDSLCLFSAVRGAAAAREKLRQGVIPTPPQYGIGDLSFYSVDWGAGKGTSPTFRWHLHSFGYLDPLIGQPHLDLDSIQLVTFLFEKWGKENLSEPYPSDYSWEEHATAVRSQRLACVLYHYTKHEIVAPATIISLAERHGEMLASDGNFQGNWNHGLDQLVGLLSLGCALARSDWIEQSASRIKGMFESVVDSEGVCNEQATAYQEYVWKLFVRANCRIAEYAPDHSLDEVRLSKMLEFLAHATQPNGYVVAIGDTLSQYKILDERRSDVLTYSLSGGRAGIPPVDRVRIYASGYIFGRTSWGARRHFDDNSFYSVRFGPGRIIHGHNDHTAFTYQCRGKDVIVDPGFSGYRNDRFRGYFRSPSAHNSCYAPGLKHLWSSETILKANHVRSNYQTYLLEDHPHPGTVRRRTLMFVHDPEIVLVWDQLHHEGKAETLQIFHFPPEAATKKLTPSAMEVSFGDSKLTMTIRQMLDFDYMRTVVGDDDHCSVAGYYAQGRDDVCTAPVLITAQNSLTPQFLTIISFDKLRAARFAGLESARNACLLSRRIELEAEGRSTFLSLRNDGMAFVE